MNRLDDYILDHIDSESPYLKALYRATNLQTVHGHMASGHLQGRLLKMIVEMIRPQRVAEVGTFSGYSALCMAEGLPEGGHLWTFEKNDEMGDFCRSWIEKSDFADRITLIMGDANVEAPKLGMEFDLAFIDGDKRTYVETLDTMLTLVRKGGFIVADNTLWDGHIIDEKYSRDHQTQGINAFNDYVASRDDLEKVILPVRDGLTIIRIKE